MKRKTRKKVITSLIILIIFIITIIGVLVIKNKTEKNQDNKVDSKLESNENYKIISKYNPNIKKSQDVKVKIDKILRGEDADIILNKYNNKASYAVDIQKKDEEESLLVEYDIDFMDFDMADIGASKDILAKLCQDDKKEYIEYNDNIYSPLIECINNDEFTNEKKVKGKFVTTIPKGCTDYKIKIGDGEHVAYFEGM